MGPPCLPPVARGTPRERAGLAILPLTVAPCPCRRDYPGGWTRLRSRPLASVPGNAELVAVRVGKGSQVVVFVHHPRTEADEPADLANTQGTDLPMSGMGAQRSGQRGM